MLIRDQLLEYDFEVEAMYDSRGVLEHLRENKDYALLILDVNLPHKDGITLASQVRDNISAGVPILFVSGDATRETRARIRRLSLSGPVDFLEKGKFNGETLFNAAMSLIRDSSFHSKLDEVHGRVTNIGSETKSIKTSVDELTQTVLKYKPLSSEELGKLIFDTQEKVCEKNQKAFCNKVDVTIATAKTAVTESVKSVVSPIVSEAIEPEAIIGRMMSRWTVKIIVSLVSTIIAGIFAWFVYTWSIATEAQDGVKALGNTTKQILDVSRQQNENIDKLRQMLRDNRSSGTTVNRFFSPGIPIPVPTSTVSTSAINP